MLLLGSALISILRSTPRSVQVLSQMSLEDRHYLAVFLSGILFSDDCSYLLFGSKPIAVAECEKFTSFHFSRYWMCEMDFKAAKGFEVFKKYQHLFSSDNIIVRLDEDEEGCSVLMINKKNLLKTLKEHIHDFKLVLGPQVTIESLFAQITRKDHLADVVNHHEALFGILLGYGRNNAWLFHEKGALLHRLNSFIPPQKRDNSLEKMYAETVAKTTFFSEDAHEYKYILKSPRLPLLHFVADPSSAETKMIKEQYSKERENMRKLFARQGFVEATLQLLMDN